MGNELLASKTIITRGTPRIRSIRSLPTAVLLMIGLAGRGPLGVARQYTDFESWRNVHGPATPDTLETWAAVQAFFEEGGQFLWFVRTAHYTDITDASTLTAAEADITADTDAATSAQLVAANAAPYLLSPSDSIAIDVDNGGPVTATFTATAAVLTSVETTPFALVDGQTLLVQINNGAVQTVTFNTADFGDITAATAAEVLAVMNAQLTDCSVSISSGAMRITSDRRGSTAEVDVTGGTAAAAFDFPAAAVGSGNVGNIAAVTYAEVKSVVEAAISGLTVTETAVGSGIPVFTSDTTGVASELEVTSSTGVQTALALPSGPENGTAGSATPTLTFTAKYLGSYANNVVARVKASTSGEAARFNLDVLENGFVVETFSNLSMVEADPNFVENVLGQPGVGSERITATALTTGRPEDGDYALAGGDDGLSGIADSDFIGSSASDTGLRAFDVVSDGTLLACPSRATAAVANAMTQYAEVTRGRSLFAVLDPPAALNAAAIIQYIEVTAGLIDNSEHIGVFWPRVKILNPNKAVFGSADHITVPNSGHICGLMARVDSARPGGVYDAPAGELGYLRSVVGLEDDPDGAERHQVLKENVRDLVYPKLINPISNTFGALAVDGTRTLKSDGNFPGLAEQRGVIFIEQSIKRGIQFARHRSHDGELRSEVFRTIERFLIAQMKLNAFRTKNPATAFFIDVGTGLNTDAVVFSNQIRIRVGLATKKTVDWVILEFVQDTRALEQELAQA